MLIRVDIVPMIDWSRVCICGCDIGVSAQCYNPVQGCRIKASLHGKNTGEGKQHQRVKVHVEVQGRGCRRCQKACTGVVLSAKWGQHNIQSSGCKGMGQLTKHYLVLCRFCDRGKFQHGKISRRLQVRCDPRSFSFPSNSSSFL